MRERPLVFIGAWESLSFRQRAGYAFTDEAEFMHVHEFSDAAFERYAKLGAGLIVLPFAKGFGLKNTPHEIADEKVWAGRAHKHDLRVGAYIRADALVPETVALDTLMSKSGSVWECTAAIAVMESNRHFASASVIRTLKQ